MQFVNRRSSGFSFAEVMFAVIIMGVGFIMIAALFPVAISQSKSNADETTVASMSRGAARVLDTLATERLMPIYTDMSTAMPEVASIPMPPILAPVQEALWLSIRGNLIVSDDPRYAWVPFFLRDRDSNLTVNPYPYATVIMICVQATNRPVFDSRDIAPDTNPYWANLRGRPVRIQVANADPDSGDPDLIGFRETGKTDGIPSGVQFVNAVAEGSFVIVRYDEANFGRLTGRLFRVGARRTDLDGQSADSYSSTNSKTSVNFTGAQVWELLPGYDFQIEPDRIMADGANTLLPEISGIHTATEAWVVGRSLKDPNDITSGFEGPAMDVSAFSTIVACKP